MNTRNIVLAALFGLLSASGAWAAANTGGIPDGRRGIAIPLGGDQVAFVEKGDWVDVMVTFDANMGPKDQQKVTATILQKVEVLDVRRPEKLEGKGAVELAVRPYEGQYAALALVQGEVRLLVRAKGDEEMKPQEMAAFKKLFAK